MKVLINQCRSDEDWQSNLDRFEAVLNSYRNTDIEYVIAPELFLTGPKFNKKALKFNQKALQSLKQLCKENGLGCIAGFLTSSTIEKKPYRNSLIVIEKNGKMSSQYDKNNLIVAFREPEFLQAGISGKILKQKFSSSKTSDFKVGLSICYDLRFPEIYRRYAKKEVELMLVIAAWPMSRMEQMIVLARARAIENQCYLLLVNSCSNQPELMAGHSMLLDARGEILVNLDAGEKTKVIDLEQEVDLIELAKYRAEFNALYQYLKK